VSRRIPTAVLLCAAVLALPSYAANLDSLVNVGGQANFRLLSEDLGAGLSYKAILPAASLGVTGFDIGIEASIIRLEHPAIFGDAVSGETSDTLVLPKVHVHKGLPFGFDVGASYAALPDSNIRLWGAELRYALVEGGPVTPAVALRGSYSTLEGVSQLKLTTTGVDVSVSKGFALFTPYAGVGKVWVRSTPETSTGLAEEDFNLNKIFVGANLNLGVANIAVEGDKTGDTTSYGIKFGWRF